MPLETSFYNDLINSAQPIDLSSYYFSDFSSTSDVDYFSFSITNSSSLYISISLSFLSNWASNPIIFSVYSAASPFYAIETYTSINSTSGSLSALYSPGDYLIKFERLDRYAYNEFGADYDFRLSNYIMDLNPPIASSFSPADGATGVSTTANITITFSESIQKGTGTIGLWNSSSGSYVETFDVATSSRLTVSGSTLTIDPVSTLDNSTGYYVTFASDNIKDLAGNAYAGTLTYDFTTVAVADTTAPTVSTFSPADGAVSVAIASSIAITFSEAIQRGSGNIVLKTATGATIATFDAASSANLSLSGNTLTINPSADLAYSTGYAVEFASGTIKDLAGNSYVGTTSYNFSTLANPVNQTLTGTSANESFTGSAGNDTIDGGADIDTALYSGNRANYTLAKASSGWTVSSASDGVDTLSNIERVKFAETSIALDISGNAGTTAKILGAVFGKAEVANKTYVGIGLSLLDGGASYQDMIQLALNAKLGDGFSTTDEVTLLYQNLLGTQVSASDLSYWTSTVNSGQFTQASLAVMAADTALNVVNINLVGLAQTGIEYS